MRLLIPLALAASLGACSLVPPLERPAPPVPAQFPQLAGAPSVAAAPLPGWRRMFGDPRLQRLIERALEQNRDLRLAALNVEATQAMFRIQSSARLPSVALEANQTRERALAADSSERSSRTVSKQVGVNLGVSAFELDLFGRVRALSDAALARYFASEEGRDAAQVALVGAVADAYFAQQLAAEQQQLAEQTLADWEQSLALARLLKQADQNSALDVAQAEGQVATAQADLEARRRARAQADNALQLLVGGELPADLPPALSLAQQPLLGRLPAGLPSELLLARPDLRQAEQVLEAANADVGAARAAFFPQISLTASFGYASTSLDGLFDPSRQVWRFAPQLTLPLFQGGALAGGTAPGQGAQVRGGGAVRASHPDRLPRGGGRPGGHGHLRPADRRSAAGRQRRRAPAGPLRPALPRGARWPAGIARCPAPAVCRAPGTAGAAPGEDQQRRGPLQGPGRWPERAGWGRAGVPGERFRLGRLTGGLARGGAAPASAGHATPHRPTEAEGGAAER